MNVYVKFNGTPFYSRDISVRIKKSHKEFNFCAFLNLSCTPLNKFFLNSPTSDAEEKTNGTAGTVEGGGTPST